MCTRCVHTCRVGPSQKQSSAQLGKGWGQEGLRFRGAYFLVLLPLMLTQLWLMPPGRVRIILYVLALPVLSGRALDCSGFAKQLYPVGSWQHLTWVGPLGPESLFRVVAQGFHLQRSRSWAAPGKGFDVCCGPWSGGWAQQSGPLLGTF